MWRWQFRRVAFYLIWMRLFKCGLSCESKLAFLGKITTRVDVVSNVSIRKLWICGAQSWLRNWKSRLWRLMRVCIAIFAIFIAVHFYVFYWFYFKSSHADVSLSTSVFSCYVLKHKEERRKSTSVVVSRSKKTLEICNTNIVISECMALLWLRNSAATQGLTILCTFLILLCTNFIKF